MQVEGGVDVAEQVAAPEPTVFCHLGQAMDGKPQIHTSFLEELRQTMPRNARVHWFSHTPLTGASQRSLGAQFTKINDPMPDVEAYEFPTLVALWKFCQANTNSLVYYVHSKSNERQRTEMLTALMDRCPKELRTGKQTCGFNYQKAPWPHYSGNFWGAQCAFVRTKRSPFISTRLLLEASAADAIRPPAFGTKGARGHGGWPHSNPPYGRFYAEYWILSEDDGSPHSEPLFRDYRALASFGSNFKSDCCLNNNIMFTVGRIARGCELAGNKKVVVVLPPDLDSGGAWRMSKKKKRKEKKKGLALLNEAAIQKLTQVALQTGCTLVSAAAAKAANLPIIPYSVKKMVDSGPYIAWFYRSMQLPPPLTTIHKQCYPPIHSNYTAVHARIEMDWYDPHRGQPYCSWRSSHRDGAKACYTPREIASAIQDLRPSTLVLLYGEPANQFAKGTGEHPLETEWHSAAVLHKSTAGKQCATSMAKLSYCERAMVDLWLAIHAQQFVGTLSSTFSNGVTIARTQLGKGQSWAYSCPAIARLVPRLDGGERGGSSTDGEACRRNDASQHLSEDSDAFKALMDPQHSFVNLGKVRLMMMRTYVFGSYQFHEAFSKTGQSGLSAAFGLAFVALLAYATGRMQLAEWGRRRIA